jgi:hypothetical protein
MAPTNLRAKRPGRLIGNGGSSYYCYFQASTPRAWISPSLRQPNHSLRLIFVYAPSKHYHPIYSPCDRGFEPVELDRHGFHAHRYCICSYLRPAGGRLRSLRSPSDCCGNYDPWRSSLRDHTGLASSSAGTSDPGRRNGGNVHLLPHYPRR